MMKIHLLVQGEGRFPGKVLCCLVLSWFFLVTGGWAAPTTTDQAQRLVAHWLARDPRPLGAVLGQAVQRVEPVRDAAVQDLYYVVYLDPAGFVIVPGDDLVEPVIAFSPDEEFSPSTDNPLGALVSRDVPRRVGAARAAEKEALDRGLPFTAAGSRKQARDKWQALLRELPAPVDGLDLRVPEISDVRVPPLVQSKWSQSYVGGLYCYNYYTPNHYVCGCVATALAQLLRFHRHPTQGVGPLVFPITVGGVAENRALRGGDGIGGPYDWDNMVLRPDAYITQVQRQAIGALTHDAGVASKMNYDYDGSAARMDDAQAALLNVFKFSNVILGGISVDVLPFPIPMDKLLLMINPNLDAGLPVVLSIFSIKPEKITGHAIVADGYGYQAATLYHHLNLGWGGRGGSDAWYNLPLIDPVERTFDEITGCIYNIFPSGAGEILSGRVVDADLQPVAGATVTAVREGGGTYTASTNDRGIYALTKLPSSSTYTINAAKSGLTCVPQTITLEESKNDSHTCGNFWGLTLGPVIPMNKALDNSQLVFTTGGDVPWFGQVSEWYYGGAAAQSGKMALGQSSTLETTVIGPGTLYFYWKNYSSTYTANNMPRLLIDDKVAKYAYSANWHQEEVAISPGRHTLKWKIPQESTTVTGIGWLDQVVYIRNDISPILPLLLGN